MSLPLVSTALGVVAAAAGAAVLVWLSRTPPVVRSRMAPAGTVLAAFLVGVPLPLVSTALGVVAAAAGAAVLVWLSRTPPVVRSRMAPARAVLAAFLAVDVGLLVFRALMGWLS